MMNCVDLNLEMMYCIYHHLEYDMYFESRQRYYRLHHHLHHQLYFYVSLFSVIQVYVDDQDLH